MNITKFIPNGVTRKIGSKTLTVKKNSPHIFFGLGIVGVGVGTILACRATLKVGDVLDEMKDDIQAVKTDLSHSSEYRRDLAYTYAHGSARLVKLYAPSVLITGASIAALTGSHVVLARRNTALTVAYAGLQKAYDEYRERVRNEYGEEIELDFYHGAVVEKTKDADGKKTVTKVVDPNKMSPYARFFDEASSEWTKDPELNRLFVTCQQNWLNNLLLARGHVFLNEAYDALGLERSAAGQVVGWMVPSEGDNHIDFGIYEARNARFVNGIERSILLDFNVDGVIYDKLG